MKGEGWLGIINGPEISTSNTKLLSIKNDNNKHKLAWKKNSIFIWNDLTKFEEMHGNFNLKTVFYP